MYPIPHRHRTRQLQIQIIYCTDSCTLYSPAFLHMTVLCCLQPPPPGKYIHGGRVGEGKGRGRVYYSRYEIQYIRYICIYTHFICTSLYTIHFQTLLYSFRTVYILGEQYTLHIFYLFTHSSCSCSLPQYCLA